MRDILPLHQDYVGRTLEFLDRPGDGAGLEPLLAPPPASYELRRMNRELFERCVWHANTVGEHGSVERFLENGLGMCLLHGGAIVCEASAGPRVLGTRELGIFTHEEHRGRGLATLTCSHLVRLCEGRGDRTYWNCATTNLASAAVADTVSFHQEIC